MATTGRSSGSFARSLRLMCYEGGAGQPRNFWRCSCHKKIDAKNKAAILPHGPAVVLTGLLVLAASSCAVCFGVKIRVDAGRKIGAIRAIHGVNGGPICCGSLVDVSPYHQALGIPLTRIHDANWRGS